MNSRAIILTAFALCMGLIGYRSLTGCKCQPGQTPADDHCGPQLPWPPQIIGTSLAFGMLSVFSVVSEELASIVAIGLTLAAMVSKNGLRPSCGPHSCATPQPASFQSLQSSQPPGTTLV